MDTQRLHILLVEDNPADVLLLREYLAGMQTDAYKLHTVERLAEAREIGT